MPRLVLGVAVALSAIFFARGGPRDFDVYWRAAHRFLGAESLYRASDGVLPYRYAPGLLILSLPLALLPLQAAVGVWYAIGIAVTSMITRVLPAQIGGRGASLAVLVGFVGILRPFLDETLYA